MFWSLDRLQTTFSFRLSVCSSQGNRSERPSVWLAKRYHPMIITMCRLIWMNDQRACASIRSHTEKQTMCPRYVVIGVEIWHFCTITPYVWPASLWSGIINAGIGIKWKLVWELKEPPLVTPNNPSHKKETEFPLLSWRSILQTMALCIRLWIFVGNKCEELAVQGSLVRPTHNLQVEKGSCLPEGGKSSPPPPKKKKPNVISSAAGTEEQSMVKDLASCDIQCRSQT